jgi:ATP-dependent RNA helicase RhlE
VNRGESPRPPQIGKSEGNQGGIKGVAFLHRESRAKPQPNRNNQTQH